MERTINSIIFSLILFFNLANLAYAEGTTKVVSLSVNGMMTRTCPTLLKSAVRKIDGVKHVDASLETKSATIEYDETKTSLDEIQKTIKSKVGFTTRLQ
jgi:mercuric ion binding protein